MEGKSPELIAIIKQEQDRYADELPPILIHRIRADYQASKIPANQWVFYAAASGNIIHQIDPAITDSLEWLILGRDKNASFNMARYNEMISAEENLNLLIHRYTEGTGIQRSDAKKKILYHFTKTIALLVKARRFETEHIHFAAEYILYMNYHKFNCRHCKIN